MHHLLTHNPGTGRKETGTSAANQPCKGGSKKKPTTPKFNQKGRNEWRPLHKGECGRIKKRKGHNKALNPWRKIRQQTLPYSKSNPTWLNSWPVDPTNRLKQIIASKSPFVVRSRTRPKTSDLHKVGRFRSVTALPSRFFKMTSPNLLTAYSGARELDITKGAVTPGCSVSPSRTRSIHNSTEVHTIHCSFISFIRHKHISMRLRACLNLHPYIRSV